jgi:hypothetical protein
MQSTEHGLLKAGVKKALDLDKNPPKLGQADFVVFGYSIIKTVDTDLLGLLYKLVSEFKSIYDTFEARKAQSTVPVQQKIK